MEFEHPLFDFFMWGASRKGSSAGNENNPCQRMNVEAAFALDEFDIDDIIREKQLRDDSK